MLWPILYLNDLKHLKETRTVINKKGHVGTVGQMRKCLGGA